VVYLPGAWNLQKIEPVDASLYKEAFDALAPWSGARRAEKK